MKVKKCPARKNCFDYKDNNCDNCDFGNEFTKLHKRIDRLKKQNETLTIQRNAWALTAKVLGNKWISVEDRLPTEQDADGDCGVIAIHKRSIKRYFHWKSVADNPFDFTHWMPLPEPPKMKGGAE